MDFTTVTWLIRFGHVLSATLWVGGYVLLTLLLIPLLKPGAPAPLLRLAIGAVRLMTYAGVATIFFGLIMVTRTRGFRSILNFGEWGLIIIACILIAAALLGIGDGALRPALRRIGQGGEPGVAQRFAWIGLGLTILAVAFMTRALYAGS